MRRKTLYALAILAFAALSGGATASWQGTWFYYDDEGALVGTWTAGCGEADGRTGIETENKSFSQGCRDWY